MLGSDNYRQLDPNADLNKIGSHTTESGPMRELMKGFIEHKKQFKRDARDIRLELPDKLARLNIQGVVVDGELILPR